LAGPVDLSDLAPDAGANPILGTTVGNYEVLDEIGRGGMGVVYLARQLGLERKVALKALHAAEGLAPRAGEQLAKESRLAGSLSHANIVTVHEYIEEQGTPYIAMEYVPRGSLRPWMGCMSVAQLAGVLEGLLAGLAAVAPSRIVHRDLKPENVMVTADGHVKIADFGIAKATEQLGTIGATSAATGVTVGTPAYMAPEQALCEEVGPWTDLYSVGVMVYEHLVGRLPFHDAGTQMAMLLCHVRDPVPEPAAVDDRIDGALSAWVSRLLIKDPAERTRSAVLAWDELEEIAIGRLGAKWRRECRLSERPRTRVNDAPRDHTQFISQKVAVETSSTTGLAFVASPISTAGTVRQPATRAAGRTNAPARRNRTLAAALSATAIAAMLGGFGIARVAEAGSGGSLRRTSLGPVSASLPSGWSRTVKSALVRGYTFDDPILARSAGPASSAATITLGLTSSASAALLPAELITTGRATLRREAIALNGRAFFRYLTPALAASTGASALVYAQPTTAGILVGICRFPTIDAKASTRGCEQILETTKTSGARALPLAQGATYTTAMAGVVERFYREHGALTTRLSSAASASAQANAAQELHQADRRTASSLRSLRPGPSEASYNAALVEAVEHIAAGHATIAAAAQAQQAGRFKQGTATVRAAWSAMRRTLAALATSG
jgi:serine/threonine protein kinase